MADFASSSQLERWILSPLELAERRQTACQRSFDALCKYGTTRMEVQGDGSLSYSGAVQDGDGGDANGGVVVRGPPAVIPEPLTVEEEGFLRRYYEYKIQDVCKAFNFPNKIQATAILYFQRFYLKWSVMEHDPKHIMLTCIYLSCKVEEFHVSAEEFGKGIKQDPGVVLKNELTVLQGLNFDLIVYAPYRSLEGFILELDLYSRDQPEMLTLDELQSLKQAAWSAIDVMMLTDACLLYPPAQLALVALEGPASQCNKIDFSKFLERLVGKRRNGHTMDELLEALREIHCLVTTDGQRPDVEQVKTIDRKLKLCRNPGSAQDAKNSEKLARKQQRRSKRASSDASMMPVPFDVSPAVEIGSMQESKRRRSDVTLL